MSADLALVGVRVRTLDPARPTATAVAIKDGVVIAVGDDADVRAQCDARTTVLSGAGWHVTPGLTDGHQHVLMGSRIARGVSFDRVSSLDEVRRLLRAERERVGPSGWVRGYAFEYDALGGLAYHHDLIDEAAGDGPMLIISLDVHTGFANGVALRMAGVTGSREFQDGAYVVVDPDGRPTGELREMAAIRTVADLEPELTSTELMRLYADTIQAQNAVGITGLHNMDGGRETLEAFASLEQAGLLTMRIRQHNWVDPAASTDELDDIEARRDLTGRLWTANSLKFMLDGVIDYRESFCQVAALAPSAGVSIFTMKSLGPDMARAVFRAPSNLQPKSRRPRTAAPLAEPAITLRPESVPEPVEAGVHA